MTKKTSDVKYLNRDYGSMKKRLISFAKTYFPGSYSDFSEANPGMLFIESAAYVGDVLSFYLDRNIKETLLSEAEENKNIVKIAQAFGYKPKMTGVASTTVDVYEVVPAILNSSTYQPDFRYARNIKPGMKLTSTYNDVTFRCRDDILFDSSGSAYGAPESVIYSTNEDVPTYYLLKKKVKVYSEDTYTKNVTVPELPKKYYKIKLDKKDFIDVTSVTDSEGNEWYEVPYLAQDTIFYNDSIENFNDYSSSRYTTPYILKQKVTSRRFITRINDKGYTELQFGAGVSRTPDELIVPNPESVGSSLPEGLSKMDVSLDPSNFMYTKTYGRVPYDTTMTIKYTYGGGIKSNVPQSSLNTTPIVEFYAHRDGLDSTLLSDVENSVYIDNQYAASGGKGRETVDEIRESALGHFATQNRVVTKEDYITRAYAMPAKYGTIAKVYVTQDAKNIDDTSDIYNPCAINMYILGYDNNRHLKTVDRVIKENLKTYIQPYRLLTDAVNILNGHIINIGVSFDIMVYKKFNKNEVIYQGIQRLKSFFDISRWQINEPIVKSEVYNALMDIPGVRAVNEVKFVNKYRLSDGYSGIRYGISEATREGILYPAVDASIFEIKYPDNDITGRSK